DRSVLGDNSILDSAWTKDTAAFVVARVPTKRAAGNGKRSVVIDGSAPAVGEATSACRVGGERSITDRHRAPVIENPAPAAIVAAGDRIVAERAVADRQCRVVVDAAAAASAAAPAPTAAHPAVGRVAAERAAA